jgi:hypothetical protein
MKIDIKELSEDELIELNHKIVERLRFLRQMNDHNEMMKFNIGDRVCFKPPGKEIQIGLLIKYNKKTVSVMTDQGQRWNVSPHLLEKITDVKQENQSPKIIDFPKKQNA